MGTLVRVDGPGFAAGIVLRSGRPDPQQRVFRASVIGEGDRLPPPLKAVSRTNYVRRV